MLNMSDDNSLPPRVALRYLAYPHQGREERPLPGPWKLATGDLRANRGILALRKQAPHHQGDYQSEGH